jgi:hypothetical protein
MGAEAGSDSGSTADVATPSQIADSGPPTTPIALDAEVPTPSQDAGSSGPTTSIDAALDAAALDAGAVLDPDSGVPVPCQTTGNVLFVDGDPGEIAHPGPLLLGPNAGAWSGNTFGYNIEVELRPSDTQYGDAWSVNFSAQQLNMPLAAQLYDDVQLTPGQSAGYPGMYISGGWQACGAISGWFRIEQVTVTPPQSLYGTQTLNSLTATFEQRCNGETAALRGCVHFQQ